MSATTGNFIDGGEIDPFKGGAGPLSLAEQAAIEDARRQRRVEESARNTSNINRRPGGFMEGRDMVKTNGINPATGKPWTGRERPKAMGDTFSDFLVESGQLVEDHPWVLGMPLAPLAGAAFAPGAVGAGTLTAPAAAAPAITTGGAVTEATIAAPIATGAATGTTTTAAAAPATADAAFTVGGALKETAPILGAVAPYAVDAIAGGNTKEQDALIAKQKQMAQEAEARRAQVQESRMNALGQQLLAMNPSNQMMAQMFGPGAAYQPEQMAAMVQNPMPPPEMPRELQVLEGNTKPLTPQQKAAYAAFAKKKQQYEQGNQQRTDMMMNGVTPPGPGPAPLQPRTPQPARKY